MMKESPISQTDTKTDFLLQKKKDHRNQIQSYEIETSPHIPNPTPESRHFNHERIAHIADKNEEKETRERERERLTIRDSSCTKQTATNRIGFLELHATHNRPRSRGSPDTAQVLLLLLLSAGRPRMMVRRFLDRKRAHHTQEAETAVNGNTKRKRRRGKEEQKTREERERWRKKARVCDNERRFTLGKQLRAEKQKGIPVSGKGIIGS
jgi:hypothetical protein